MSELERRSSERCPVCQGPTTLDSKGAVKCRNSLCHQNHRHVACPRCQSGDLESVARSPGGKTASSYSYTCASCQLTWEG